MPGPSPLVGYNTNVRHKGKLYHIQTEDSGVNHPHVITHLFADGGRIIASRKTAYAEHLGASELNSIVKRLMQEQHKSMFIELRDCVYDEQPAVPSAESAPVAVMPAPSAPVAAATAPNTPAPRANVGLPLTRPVGSPPPPPPPSSARSTTAFAALPAPPPVGAPASSSTSSSTTAAMAAAAAAAAFQAPSAKQSVGARGAVAVPAPKFVGTPPPMAVPTRTQVPLDTDELDRAAEARLLGSAFGRMRAEAARRGVGRYQQTLVAKTPRAPRATTARSTFGGEALRGKSLDEVILSYLSDDAGETER